MREFFSILAFGLAVASIVLHSEHADCSKWRHHWGPWANVTWGNSDSPAEMLTTGVYGNRRIQQRICAHCDLVQERQIARAA